MFVFKDIFKSTIWGGTKISRFKGCDNITGHIGESWEISAIEGCESVVEDGPDKGLSLSTLVEKYGNTLLGKAVTDRFGMSFPLLFKYIDANDDLSIQVHPDDDYAMRHHMKSGKTEMWYVMDSDKDATLKVGFKKDMTRKSYQKAVEDSTIADKMMMYKVKKGDVFFIPAGRVHTIGSGTFLVEIQQSNDVTYRIFDYNRVDKDGNQRQLHTELAVDVIDFKAQDDYRTDYTVNDGVATNLVTCRYFTTNLLTVSNSLTRDYHDIDSFVVIMCTKGNAEIVEKEERRMLRQGDTVLIPASSDSIQVNPSEPTEMLEVYIEK